MSEDNTEGLPLPPESQHDLKNCFNVILNRKKLVVKRDELEAILQNNLNIDIAKLNSRLASVLADSLVMYMRMWPGWQNSVLYFTGKLMVEDWFEQFRQYLMMKINYIILNEKHYLDLLKLDNFGNTADAGLQTWQINKKEMAPYSLMIHGTPSILSDVIFMQRGSEF